MLLSYAAAHVPAGVLSITIGMVPILTYIASTFLGLEKFAMGRIFGVILGALAVVLLVAPESSLPDPGGSCLGRSSALSPLFVMPPWV